jgi:ribosomal protein S17E
MGVLHEMQDDGDRKFKRGQAMTRQQVKETIKNPHVQRAFTMVDYDTLPPAVREDYESLDEFFGKYSEFTEKMMRAHIAGEFAKQVEKELEQEREKIHAKMISIAKLMLENRIPDEVILSNTTLSLQALLALKQKTIR